MVAGCRPAKPGANDQYAIRDGERSHNHADNQANNELLGPVVQRQTQKCQWQVKNSDVEKGDDGQGNDAHEHIGPQPAPGIGNCISYNLR